MTIATNKYVGSRYVPKIIGDWDNTKNTEYESLSIVQYSGNSYTSKCPVPKGIDILNTAFWVKTSDFNVQLANYEQVVENNTQLVNEYNASLETYKTATNQTLTAQSETNVKVDNSISDIMNSDKMSRHIALPVNTNNSHDLNTALSEFASRNIKYAYIDENIDLELTTPLEVDDRLLFGRANVGLISPDNFLHNISDTFESFKGKINSNFCKFARLKTAIASGNPINITVWGDSLSTNGSLLNVNTSNVSGAERSPDTWNEGDSYTSFLYDKLSDVFYDKTINFNNVAISGTRLSQWNDTQYMFGESKPWIEHVKTTTPDILIIAFGANHNDRDLQRAFAYNVKQIIDYINTNFTIIPDIVLMTPPRPAYKTSTVYGNYLAQSTRQGVANVCRNIAPKYKTYLIDVNKNSNIIRSGTDWLNPTFEEVTDISKYVSNVKDLNGNYVLDSTANSLIINKYMKDFVLKFTATFNNAIVDGDCLTIKTNHTYDSSVNNNQIVINPKLTANSGFGHIKAITNIADYVNWTTNPTTAKALTTAITTIDLRIEKRNNILEVHQEGSNVALWSVLLRDRCNVWDIQGVIQFSLGIVTSGFNCVLSNFKLFAPVYKNYLPTLNDNTAYGQFLVDDVTTVRAKTGGNGVNHPSAKGIIEMFLPCINEFVEDIANVYRNS
jgi:hypothetical protein